MFKRFYRALITLLGLLCGAGVSFLSLSLLQRIEGFEKFQLPVSIGLSAVVIISFGIIFYFVAPYIQRSL